MITHSKYHVEAKGLTVRPYRPSDAPALRVMYQAEGIQESETNFANGGTGVLVKGDEIIGVFTLELNFIHVHLRHFCVARGHRRDQSNAWKMIHAAKRTALMSGYGRMIVGAKGKRMIRIVRAYFRMMPYGQADDGTAFFFVRT